MNRTASTDSSRPFTSTEGCQQDHQRWQQIICQQEEEIRQLRALLLDVMNHYNSRSLRHDAVDYYRDLNKLQIKLDRLHRDLVCERADCLVAEKNLACADSRFGLSATIERHATLLAHEFTRIKDGCLQFLAGMMSLNRL
ncbi:hypothetical protein [Spirosoma sp.]|uniref:hypothetical protein n=1 Tax=Spirosoma sp. TaxID=1899569 RepID=UPI003B3A270D